MTNILSTDPVKWDEDLLILRDMYGDPNLRGDVFKAAEEEAKGERSKWADRPVFGGK
jgi:hypothetical protein